MTPRTILILALGALVCVIAVLTEPKRPVADLAFGATVVTAQGETNRYPDLHSAMAAAKEGDTVYPDEGSHVIMSKAVELTPMFTNVPQTLPEWEAQLIAGGYTPEQARKTTLLLATGLVNLANAHRTNRTMPGVRTSVNTNRFPILEP